MFPGFYLLGKFIGSYQIAALAGILSAGGMAVAHYKKRYKDGYPMLAVMLVSAAGAFVGAGLMYGLTNIRYWHILAKAEDVGSFISAFRLIFGGGVYYGGLLGGALTAFVYMRSQRYDKRSISDMAAPCIALFHSFGRAGCFMGGCCYGIESEFGVVFTRSLVESANGVRRLPVQLFEAVFELVLFIVLSLLLKKGILSGRLFTLYLLMYSVWRFFIEFLRGDAYRGFILGLSVSQLISIFVFLYSVLMFILYRKRPPSSSRN